MPTTNQPLDPADTHDRLTGALYSHKAKWRDFGDDIDRMIELCITATPKTEKRPTPPAIQKLPITLAIIGLGLAAVCVAAGYPNRPEVRPVTAIDTRSASAACLAGKAAMLRGDYREAIDHFQDAGVHGAAAEAWLPGMIECRLAVGKQCGLVESLCAELANACPRNQSLVPYYRGCALVQRGERDAARSELYEAKKLGHPMADVVLRGMGAG